MNIFEYFDTFEKSRRNNMAVVKQISIIIPLHNEEDNVNDLIDRTVEALKLISEKSEIICVDDGSKDETLNRLLVKQQENDSIKIIQLSRNFGHQSAYIAGLKESKSEYTFMMDGDLQDPPELIPVLFDKINNSDFDIVYAKRKKREEGFLKKILILVFHKLFSKITSLNAPENVGNFSVMKKNALNALLTLPEKNIYLPGLRFYIGFNQGFIEYDRDGRSFGDSLSFSRLFKLAFDAIFSFSKIPIKISLIIGILGILFSLMGSSVVIYKKIIGEAITGWTSQMLALFFFGSVQLFFLGILGEYVFRIFIETKDRPTYFVKKVFDKTRE